MAARVIRRSLVFAAASSLMWTSLGAQKGPALPELLKLAGDALIQYAERLKAVAADEEYLQHETTGGLNVTPKRVSSRVVWLGVSEGAVESFRDAIAIDSLAIRPKDERLLELFKAPTRTSRAEARQLTEDAVRQYIDANLHLFDDPTLALEFLRPVNQSRSTFKIESVRVTNGVSVAVLKFTQNKNQRVVPTPQNASAVGRFWIDTASGTVRQTELGVGDLVFSATVTVKYVSDGATNLWLPAEMSQHLRISSQGSSPINHMGANGGYNARQEFDGRATYANYRQIAVDFTKLR